MSLPLRLMSQLPSNDYLFFLLDIFLLCPTIPTFLRLGRRPFVDNVTNGHSFFILSFTPVLCTLMCYSSRLLCHVHSYDCPAQALPRTLQGQKVAVIQPTPFQLAFLQL